MSHEEAQGAQKEVFVNRLKVLSNLDPIGRRGPTEGRIDMHIGSVGEVVMHTRFDDAARTVRVRVELLGPDARPGRPV